jgi:hypothetical protein
MTHRVNVSSFGWHECCCSIIDVIIDFVECTFERGAGAVQTGNWGSQVGAQKAAVGPEEEEGGTEAEFW